jgi:transposase
MGTARRKFTRQYKVDAVQLYQDSGLTMGQVAQQLGIGESTLQSWVKNVKDEGDVAAGETPLTQAEKKRIRDLEAELRRVNMENAFLKKASAYFASQNL